MMGQAAAWRFPDLALPRALPSPDERLGTGQQVDSPDPFLHPADNFVPGNHREDTSAPFVPSLVNIGMAHAAVEDLDQDVVSSNFPSREIIRR
jgi:hypothetical protein